MVELLPCPFCGSDMSSFVPEPEGCAGGGAGDYYVECDCGAMGAGGKTVAEAIAGWNRRTAAQGEQSKATDAAFKDAMLYGTGAYRLNPDGSAEHIPTQDLRIIQSGSAEQASELEKLLQQVEFVLSVTGPLSIQQSEVWPELKTRAAKARAALSAPERKVTDAAILKLADDFGIDYDGSFYRNPDEDKANLLEFARALLNQQYRGAETDANPSLTRMDARSEVVSNQQGEQTAPEGWISVKDRLPAAGKEVLINGQEGIEIATYSEAEQDSIDEMGHDAGWIGYKFAMPGRSFGNPDYMREPQGQPTHWMLLPAAPSTAQNYHICKSCGVDRRQEGCKGDMLACAIRAAAQKDGGME